MQTSPLLAGATVVDSLRKYNTLSKTHILPFCPACAKIHFSLASLFLLTSPPSLYVGSMEEITFSTAFGKIFGLTGIASLDGGALYNDRHIAGFAMACHRKRV